MRGLITQSVNVLTIKRLKSGFTFSVVRESMRSGNDKKSKSSIHDFAVSPRVGVSDADF